MNELQIVTKEKMDMLDVYAENVIKSGIVPAGINTKEKVKIVMLTGSELGMKPMESLTNLFVVNGRCSMMAQNMISLIYRGCPDAIINKKQSTDKICEIEASRDGEGFETFSFSIEDAKRANLLGKTIWQQYPTDMLWARAVSRMARRLFADVLAGATHTPEELGAEVDALGNPKSSYSTPAASVNERTADISSRLETLKDVSAGPAPTPINVIPPLPVVSKPPIVAVVKEQVWGKNTPEQDPIDPKKDPVKVDKPKKETKPAKPPVKPSPKPLEPPEEIEMVSDEPPMDVGNFDDFHETFGPEEEVADDYGDFRMPKHPSASWSGKTFRELGKERVKDLALKTQERISKTPVEKIEQSTVEFLNAAEIFIES